MLPAPWIAQGVQHLLQASPIDAALAACEPKLGKKLLLPGTCKALCDFPHVAQLPVCTTAHRRNTPAEAAGSVADGGTAAESTGEDRQERQVMPLRHWPVGRIAGWLVN